MLALMSIGALGAGLLVGTAWKASATTNPTGDSGDTYSGGTLSFFAVAGVSTGEIQVGSYSDSDDSYGLNELSAVIQWGDGSSSSALVDDSNGNVFGTHTYTSVGVFPVTVDFSDADEQAVTLTDGNQGTTLLSDGSATVVAPDITGSSVNIAPVENTSFSGVVANYIDSDNPGCELGIDVTAIINWGDGSGSVGNTSSCGVVTGTHTYLGDEGASFPISVDIVDSDETSGVLADGGYGNAELSGGTATLADGLITTSPTAPTLVEGAPYSNVVLGTITDTDPLASPSDYSVTQTCYNDQGPNTPNDCKPAALTPVVNHSNQFQVSGSGVFLEEGTYHVQTFISDGEVNPQEVVMNTTVTVKDAAVTVTTVTAIQAKPKATFKKVVANFTDADPHGTTSDYTATINWGDGSPNTAGAVAPNGLGGWSVTGTHSYNKAGGYSVTVTVNDSGGAQGSTVDVVRAK